jgi:FkbM family methyltransferase
MRVLKTSSALFVGLMLWAVIFQYPVAMALVGKVSGGDQPCPWTRLVRYPWEEQRFASLQRDALHELSVEKEDTPLGIQLVRTSGRAFWIKKDGRELNGRALLAYVLAEQKWTVENEPNHAVKPGDVVVDVGAHIGTFDDDALRRGASKCILVEPDPVNVQCIRRTFSREIAQGRIVVVPEGAWSSRSTLEFAMGLANSGTGSFVLRETGAKTISVTVRTLDEILANLNVGRVDFIKMDIEGAEREALKGANQTLRRWKPVLMIDSYHRPDDDVVLPRVIHDANPSYHAVCAACSPDRLGSQKRFVPYIVFYN